MELYFHVLKFFFFFLKIFAVFLVLLIYTLKVSFSISFKSKKNYENYLNILLNKFQRFAVILYDIKIKDL